MRAAACLALLMSRLQRRRLRWPLRVLAGLAALALVLRMLPADPLSTRVARSTAIYAESGELMRLTLADDQQYRLWVRLDDVSPRLPQAVQLYEDRWFKWHPGVNPAALVRSAAGVDPVKAIFAAAG